MHGKRGRLIGDGYPPGITDESIKQDISVLLDRIHEFYKAALDRLPMGTIPSLAPRLLKAGMCFGFLDPVSNIITNTIAFTPSPMPGSDEEEAGAILPKILTDMKDESVFDVPLDRHKARGMSVARRSLDGLISFLTSQYRYLACTEALHYLRLAGADLLAAVRLIEEDRNKRPRDELAFSMTSLTTKVALECAAISSRHPEPEALVDSWLGTPSGPDPASAEAVDYLSMLLSTRPWPTGMDHIGASDLCGEKKKRKKRKRSEQDTHSTFRYTQSLKLLLLGKIHGLYLQALARLPRDGLRKRHHCSLLKGGYLYGPRDPISNIILNTIWYGSVFPTQQEFEIPFKVDMICTESLARMECCSLYGLVAFMRACFPSLTEQGALICLFRSAADLRKAILRAQRDGHIMGDHLGAYKEAAIASWHPDPDALVEHIKWSMNMKSPDLSAMRKGRLTNERVERLTMAMPTNSGEQAQQLNQVSSTSPILSKKQELFIWEIRKKFKDDQRFFVKKVNAALKAYCQQNGVQYELHVICGVNTEVTEGSSTCLFKKKFKFEYSHINFLAKTKEPNSTPVLFFAQCSNSGKDEEKRPSWCLPVSESLIDDVRCYCCEINGTKIVHPHNDKYCGLYEDFNKMADGDHGIINEFLIDSCDLHVDEMGTLMEDWVYFDPNMDAKIAKMNPISNVDRELRFCKGRIH